MNISSVNTGLPVTRLQGRTAITNGTQASQDESRLGADTVEISDVAKYLGDIKNLPDVRQSKVDSIRQAIADGTYDTDDKLDAVVSGLMEDLA